MKPTDLKTKISESLANFQNPEPVRAHGVRPTEPAIVGADGVRPKNIPENRATSRSPLRETATSLLNTLGYRSDKTYPLDDNTPRAFFDAFDPDDRLNHDKALLDKWLTADLLVYKLYGLTWAEVKIMDPAFAPARHAHRYAQMAPAAIQNRAKICVREKSDSRKSGNALNRGRARRRAPLRFVGNLLLGRMASAPDGVVVPGYGKMDVGANGCSPRPGMRTGMRKWRRRRFETGPKSAFGENRIHGNRAMR